MLGAIIGDVIGSPYEFGLKEKRKDFRLWRPECRATDDSVLTVAVGVTCAEGSLDDETAFKELLVGHLLRLTRLYPDAGYGDNYYAWSISARKEPYGGVTNGAAMRVSPVAWAGGTLEQVERLARWSAEVTHNSPEGIRGAQAVAAAVFLARTGKSKEEIRAYIDAKYYPLNFTIDEIRPTYTHSMTCEGSVPQAIVAFLDSDGFEDAIRNAVSLGGDGDTQAAIAGAIAEAYYGIPDELYERAIEYVDEPLLEEIEGYTAALMDF